MQGRGGSIRWGTGHRAFNRLRRQELILYQGAVTVVNRTYLSFVLQNLALDLNGCTTILQAELGGVLPYGTVETMPMQLGRSEDAPAGVDSSNRSPLNPGC